LKLGGVWAPPGAGRKRKPAAGGALAAVLRGGD